MAANSGMSLRQLAKGLGVSQSFLSQIRAGKRPMPGALKERVEALGAYHLLIGDKQNLGPGGGAPAELEAYVGAEGGIRTHTPARVADFKSAASTIPPPRPLLLRYPPNGMRRSPGR